MIFLEEGKFKFSVLFILAIIVSLTLFVKRFEWMGIARQEADGEKIWEEIYNEGTATFAEIKDSVEVGVENLKEAGEELEKKEDQQKLFEEVQGYLDNKNNTSTATSSEE